MDNKLTLALVVFLITISQQSMAGLIGISSSTDSAYSIDSSTGAATLITAIDGNVSLSGASFLDNNLYATDIFGGSLYMGSINLSTGDYTGIADQDGSANWHGLATDESAGLLYSIGINNTLYSITASGTITSIGTGTNIDGRGMAFDDASGILYATGGSNLYTVDTLLGTSALVGGMGIGSDYMGLAYDEINDILYANGSSIGANSLYTLDINTGAATSIGLNGVNGIDGLAWIDAGQVPEPATLALFGIGLAGLGFARKKRKSA